MNACLTVNLSLQRKSGSLSINKRALLVIFRAEHKLEHFKLLRRNEAATSWHTGKNIRLWHESQSDCGKLDVRL